VTVGAEFGTVLARVAPAPPRVRAAADRLDAWVVPLAPPEPTPPGSRGVTTDDERARAARMRVGGVRWLAARAALRRVLARYLDLPPARIPIAPGPDGKPRLAAGMPDLRFNLSHADDLALVGVRLGHDVGVDVERVRHDVDGAAIARTLFTPRERAMMAALTAASPHEAFFHAWVRREALAKASGRGIAAPASEREIAGFAVRELRGIPGCAAAVASAGTGWVIARER
jgi:4'-phosphopantetheinyl transferase